MFLKNINKSSGQIAKTLLVLVVIIIVAIVIAFIVVQRAKPKPLPAPLEPEVIPVYQVIIGDIKFIFMEATDKGSVLRGKESRQPEWQKDLITTERFIYLTVGAQNTGKENTPERIWGVGEIIDSEGRKFVPSGQEVNNWLPQYEENLCGSVLKPSFEPTPCEKIYEVAKISTGLKIKVFLYDKGYSDKIAEEAIIDIKLMP